MSFEDDMIEYGFTDGNDYMDYLYNEANKIYERQKEHEELLESLSEDEIEYYEQEKKRKRLEEKKDVLNMIKRD